MVWASYKGHADIVRELLDYGADPNERGQVSHHFRMFVKRLCEQPANQRGVFWAQGREDQSA